MTLFDRFTRYLSPKAELAIKRYVALARKYDLDPSQMALSYVNTRSFLTSNIIGATSVAQVQENINSLSINLSDEILSAIGDIHQRYTHPAP